MFLSSCLARSSCAATILRRDSLRSSIRRTFRSTSPACDARSLISLARAGFMGSFSGMTTDNAPSSSPWWRTSTAVSSSGKVGSASPRKDIGARSPATGDEAADHRYGDGTQVDDEHERRQDAEHDRLLDHDVEVVEAVLQDGDRTGNGDADREDDGEPKEGHESQKRPMHLGNASEHDQEK